MKNIFAKAASFIQLLIQKSLQAITEYLNGKKLVFIQLLMILIAVMQQYQDMSVISPAWAAVIITSLNIIIQAISSSRPVLETGLKWDGAFFWINLLALIMAISDVWLQSGLLTPKVNLALATILIIIRTIGMNQKGIPLKSTG